MTAPAEMIRAESREPVLQFAFGRSLAYAARLRIVLGLLVAGVALQVIFLSVLPGLPFLVAAVALGWVRGFDNRMDAGAFRNTTGWTTVPFAKVAEILRLDRAMKDWDASAVDASSPLGAFLFLLLGFGIASCAALLGASAGPAAGVTLLVDGLLLLLFQWFSGMRTVDRRPELVLKALHLDRVVRAGEARLGKNRAVSAQVLAGDDPAARAPRDVRMSVGFEGAPAHFLGVMGQVVLNRVQGTPYPYFYCVVVAKAGHGLLEHAREAARPAGILVEAKREGDVEIAVVRQMTSKTSGYHTDVDRSVLILGAAADLARTYLQRGA